MWLGYRASRSAFRESARAALSSRSRFGSTCLAVPRGGPCVPGPDPLPFAAPSRHCRRAINEIGSRRFANVAICCHAVPLSCEWERECESASIHFRTCSITKTPFLLADTTSSRPSLLNSATTNWVPIPLWSSISRGVKVILPSGPRLAWNQ
jgi:hypothetical protein